MTQLIHRHCHHQPPVAQRGEGVYLFDQAGKRYFDACGGAAVSNLGHNNPVIKQAISQQLDSLPFVHSGFFTTEVAEKLAEKLVQLSPEPLNHVYLVSGGSEAVESALKLARQYFLEQGKESKSQFIARRQSYHGNTLGALSVGGNEWRRAPFRPLLKATHHISPCYPYRDKKTDETEFEYGQRVANELEQTLLGVGADNVMAFVAETVVGATAGSLAPVEGYFKRIREICDKYDVLLILDEVMCGVGRTGSFYAFEQEGIVPDMVTIAKGLGGGYQPIGATVVSSKIYQTIALGTGYFQHGHTFNAHPMACASALATVTEIVDGHYLKRVNSLSEKLFKELRTRFDHHPNVGDIRGRGLFIGLELVEEKATKTPFSPSSQLEKKVKATAMEKGLMCYPMKGTIDGQNGHHVLLAPHFIMSDEQVFELVDRLEATLEALFAEELVCQP
ncbi:aspartate aminotransferase family protein [Vibrio nigripulchritudo]|uniref:aspartate aminotransferase family protein n=1 Tax=Vibrio nigripulchritudo TaxID=28173 RepID=UPI0024915DBA|nr:aspartate aminotransferase family protein [Vibrio nigripulchritudo]BDU37801.1 aspartate aminotransferase family protein [Vibrio nigripulchritudo]BDU43521.1 aspartate aminotransferase family protein [Vibrio nigripulchritudo]